MMKRVISALLFVLLVSSTSLGDEVFKRGVGGSGGGGTTDLSTHQIEELQDVTATSGTSTVIATAVGPFLDGTCAVWDGNNLTSVTCSSGSVTGLNADTGIPTTVQAPTIFGGNCTTTSSDADGVTIDFSGCSFITGITAPGGTAIGPTVDLFGDNGIVSTRSGNLITHGFGGTTPLSPGPLIGLNFPTRNPDDVAGVADGAGADPNPIAWDRSSQILSGAVGVPFANSVNWVYCVAGYNSNCINRTSTGNYGIHQSMEFSYDVNLRSGAEKAEWHLSYAPASFVVTFSAGSGPSALGDNLTFSGGEICRPGVARTLGVDITQRMLCDNDDAPDSGDVITGGCTGCTGTVSGTPVADIGYSPWSMAIDTGTAETGTNLTMKRDAGGAYYAMVADPVNRWVALGWNSINTPDASYASRVSAPAFDDLGAHGQANAHPYFRGDFAFDTSNESTIGAQFVYAGATGGPRRVLVPTDTDYYQFNNVSAATDGVNVPWGHYQPVTITAVACRNDSTVTPTVPAWMLLKTLSGSSITGIVTCVGKESALAWTTTVDTDAIDPIGVKLDTFNTPNPAGDSYTLYIARQSTMK